jgi:hypothetical protein
MYVYSQIMHMLWFEKCSDFMRQPNEPERVKEIARVRKTARTKEHRSHKSLDIWPGLEN